MKNLFSFVFLGFATLFIVACKGRGGEAAVTSEATEVAIAGAASQTYHVVPAASTLYWEGYKPATTHTGTVDILEGTLTVRDGRLESGNFIMDMMSVTSTDLEPGDSKVRLESHLRGTLEDRETDFFHATVYPTSRFEITRVTALENDPDANYMIYGNLTIRDITKNVGFRAKVDITPSSITAKTPLFNVDRTEWDIKVLSNKFFDNLQDRAVNDEFGLKIELRAEVGQDI